MSPPPAVTMSVIARPGRIAATEHSDSGLAPTLLRMTRYPLACNVAIVSAAVVAVGAAEVCAAVANPKPPADKRTDDRSTKGAVLHRRILLVELVKSEEVR